MAKQSRYGDVRHNGRVTVAARDLCSKCKTNRRIGRSPWCRPCLEANPVRVGRQPRTVRAVTSEGSPVAATIVPPQTRTQQVVKWFCRDH